jgi:predicted transcriptional regulator
MLSARALGVLITAACMNDGISAEKLANRLQESIPTILKALAELKAFGLVETKHSKFRGRHMNTTPLTNPGHIYVNEYLESLKKNYWGFSA